MSQSNAVSKPGRGGPRPNSGRKLGSPNRKPWQRFLDNVEAVATRQFNRKQLEAMAEADPWRFVERVAMPLAKPQLEININGVPDEQLPLVFVEDQNAIIGEIIEGELADRGIDLRELVRDK